MFLGQKKGGLDDPIPLILITQCHGIGDWISVMSVATATPDELVEFPPSQS